MKKVGIFIFGLLSMLLVVGCGNGKDMTNFVDVKFTGMDSKGMATYQVDEDKLIKEVFDVDVSVAFPDQKTQQEIMEIEDAYKIKLDKDSNLSNGDEVKLVVTVDEEKTKKIKGGETKIKVKGLSDPEQLTTKDVEKNLVVNFNGVSGRGKVTIDNVFDSPLNNISFKIENDGKLKNGDKAKILFSKEDEVSLNNQGYILEKNFSPSFEVTGLKNVAEKATDISNLEDIKRMVDEEARRTYKDSGAEYSFGLKYEINQEKLMYRQFNKDNSKESNYSSYGSSFSDNGNLIGIYSIKEYSGGTESKLKRTFTSIIGFSDIILDENNATNVAELKEISDTKDDTYSLESVLKLYEGYGYTEIK